MPLHHTSDDDLHGAYIYYSKYIRDLFEIYSSFIRVLFEIYSRFKINSKCIQDPARRHPYIRLRFPPQ